MAIFKAQPSRFCRDFLQISDRQLMRLKHSNARVPPHKLTSLWSSWRMQQQLKSHWKVNDLPYNLLKRIRFQLEAFVPSPLIFRTASSWVVCVTLRPIYQQSKSLLNQSGPKMLSTVKHRSFWPKEYISVCQNILEAFSVSMAGRNEFPNVCISVL